MFQQEELARLEEPLMECNNMHTHQELQEELILNLNINSSQEQELNQSLLLSKVSSPLRDTSSLILNSQSINHHMFNNQDILNNLNPVILKQLKVTNSQDTSSNNTHQANIHLKLKVNIHQVNILLKVNTHHKDSTHQANIHPKVSIHHKGNYPQDTPTHQEDTDDENLSLIIF